MKTKDIIYIIIILILGGSTYYFWQENEMYSNNLRVQTAKLQTLTQVNGQLVSQMDAYKVTEKELREEVWVKDDSLRIMTEKFKDFVGTVKVVTKYKLDTIRVPTTINPDNANERLFSKTTPYYSFAGRVGLDFVAIDSLRVPNTQRLVIGRHKGFWNRTITADITNSNPHVVTEGIETQIVLSERVKRWGIGPFIGLDVLFRPTFGFGVSWDLYQF